MSLDHAAKAIGLSGVGEGASLFLI